MTNASCDNIIWNQLLKCPMEKFAIQINFITQAKYTYWIQYRFFLQCEQLYLNIQKCPLVYIACNYTDAQLALFYRNLFTPFYQHTFLFLTVLAQSLFGMVSFNSRWPHRPNLTYVRILPVFFLIIWHLRWFNRFLNCWQAFRR